MRALLDTHVLVWWLGRDQRLSRRQAEILESAGAEAPLLVAGISLWEIATLYELGRLEFQLPLREWLEQATAGPLVELVSLTPAIAAEVANLPDSFHRDPADRIIVATARILGATLLTRDRRIIESDLVSIIT